MTDYEELDRRIKLLNDRVKHLEELSAKLLDLTERLQKALLALTRQD